MRTKGIMRFGGLMMALALAGCMKSLYDPNIEREKENDVPPMDEYFDFATTTDVSLYVNYSLQGMPLLLELYRENPVVTKENGVRSKRQDIYPLFMAYTDDKGKYEGTITLPIGLTTVYLYSREFSVPECVELEVVDNAIVYDHSAVPSVEASATRAYTFTGAAPYAISAKDNIYSLCKWTDEGVPVDAGTYFVDRGSTDIPVWNETEATSEKEGIGSFTGRLKDILWNRNTQKTDGLDNKGLVGKVEQTNFYIAKETEVTLMFLHERAGYLNTFGYYYYKGSDDNTDPSTLRKYIIFPNVSIKGDDPYNASSPSWKKTEVIKVGDKVKLKFFGEDGTKAGSDKFPEGYTIGWFLIPDGFLGSKNITSGMFGNSGDKNELQNINQIRTSNDADKDRKFISVYDERLRGVVVGCEDGPDDSYEDMLFCVFTADMDAIIDPKNPGRPAIDKDQTGEIIKPSTPGDATEPTVGTLAFEDIWPSGGDYDMNDVIVEYTRAITFNYKNEVVKITDTFTPVHDGAGLTNGFAYQIDASQMGKVINMPAESTVETETSSIIVFADAPTATREGKSFTIERDLSGSGIIAKKDIKPYNPFIFRSEAGKENRVEVHLPKQSPTSLADKSLNNTNDDAYYIRVSGKYAFAINIPIHGFTPTSESAPIDAPAEYPDFRAWADSNGETNTDWYLNYAGVK